MIKYKLIRSKRKTIGVYITSEALVEVRAPLKLELPKIEQFVIKKEDWIKKKIALATDRNTAKASFKLDYGSKVLYLGKEIPILAKPGKEVGYDGTCFYLPENLPSQEIKMVVIKLYKSLTRQTINERVAYFSAKLGLKPKQVKINSAKTRWGSCSNRGNLNFSWRLIMASEAVIDYLVVHELAHLKEANHSQHFWNLVAYYLPNYQKQKAELRKLAKRLQKEDWD